MRPIVKKQAALGILTTFMICFVLGLSTMLFSKLTTDLVVTPIENMIKKVEAITSDPLKAAHDEEENLLLQELEEKSEFDKA